MEGAPNSAENRPRLSPERRRELFAQIFEHLDNPDPNIDEKIIKIEEEFDEGRRQKKLEEVAPRLPATPVFRSKVKQPHTGAHAMQEWEAKKDLD